MRFPTLLARDLEGDAVTIPDDLPSGPRVILLPFLREHQPIVDGWVRGLRALGEARSELSVFEVPAISWLYAPGRFYIDGGMRAGIPSIDTRRHTLTVYTDVEKLARELEIPSRETVHVFLVDSTGEITWRSSGEASAEKVSAIAEAIQALESGGGTTLGES